MPAYSSLLIGGSFGYGFGDLLKVIPLLSPSSGRCVRSGMSANYCTPDSPKRTQILKILSI